MRIDHIAVWTDDLEGLKEYYVKYYEGKAGDKYTNISKQFESYFVTFSSGGSLEVMRKTGIPDNMNDTVNKQHKGLIHIAFGCETTFLVDEKLKELSEAGFTILSGPRVTGDGYYEFETLDPDNNRIEVVCKTDSTGK